MADESQLSDSSVRSAQYKEGPSLAVEAGSVRISSSNSTDSSFNSSRDSKLAAVVTTNGDKARALSARMASPPRFPYRLLGVNPFRDEEKGYRNSEDMLRDLLDEVMYTFIMS